MSGDYLSSIDPIPALIIAAILVILFIIVALVQYRREHIKLETTPEKTRATYVSAQNISLQGLDEITKETDAIARPRH